MKTVVSVVIPCKNEVLFIEECIHAIFNSKLPKEVVLNVLVIDGMSTDGTRDIVRKLSVDFPSLKLLDNKKELTPFAFNIGIHATDFNFLQIVGARHIISSNYISSCLEHIRENDEIWCAGGRLINSYKNETARIIASAMATPFGMGIGNFRTLDKTTFTDTVTSPMYPRFVFDKIGYFDERLVRNQDDDFNYRLTKAGGKILFIKEIQLKYYVRASLRNLRRQFYQYGYWKVFVNKKHKAITTLRQLVPMLFVLFILFSVLSLLYLPLFVFLCFPILVLYIMMVMVFGIKLVNSFKNLGVALLVYPVMHFSYGFGYLKGILNFLVLNKKPSDKQKRLSR